ncbi:MAG: hypothetical protein APR63_03845 [Desulfuromonas sp. SDB]|nr:MAG: hypothetical protein APR63_03845 [Desulfuromonas sp. SDB]
MGIESRKKKDRKIREQEIIQAADKVLSAKGIDNTTMDDIAKQAEFTKKTLYSYFISKEEIFTAIFIDLFTNHVRNFEISMKKQDQAIEKLKALANAYYDFYHENPHILDLMLYFDLGKWNYNNVREGLKETLFNLNQKAVNRIESAFQLGIENKEIRDDIDVQILVFNFVTSIRAVLFQVISGFWKDNLDFYQNFLNVYFDGIKKKN